jgi:hypothetical protein
LFEEPVKAREDFDITSVKFEPDESTGSRREIMEPMPLSRDLALTGPGRVSASTPLPPPSPVSAAPADAVTQVLPLGPAAAPETVTPSPPPPAPFEIGAEPEPAPEAPPEPAGRVLADLYFVQGHYAEALAIYDDMVAANPHDAELRRLRRDAEARLLPAAATPAAASSDTALERRLGKIRALKRWLSVVQTG